MKANGAFFAALLLSVTLQSAGESPTVPTSPVDPTTPAECEELSHQVWRLLRGILRPAIEECHNANKSDDPKWAIIGSGGCVSWVPKACVPPVQTCDTAMKKANAELAYCRQRLALNLREKSDLPKDDFSDSVANLAQGAKAAKRAIGITSRAQSARLSQRLFNLAANKLQRESQLRALHFDAEFRNIVIDAVNRDSVRTGFTARAAVASSLVERKLQGAWTHNIGGNPLYYDFKSNGQVGVYYPHITIVDSPVYRDRWIEQSNGDIWFSNSTEGTLNVITDLSDGTSTLKICHTDSMILSPGDLRNWRPRGSWGSCYGPYVLRKTNNVPW